MHPFFPPPGSTPTQNHQPNRAPQGPPIPSFAHHQAQPQFPFQPNPNNNNNFAMGMNMINQNPMLGFNQTFQALAAMQLLSQMQQQQQGQQMVHNNINFLGAGQLFANNLVQGFDHMVHNNNNSNHSNLMSGNNNNPILPPFANNMVQMNQANTSNPGQNYNNNNNNNSTQNSISQARFQNNNQFNPPNNQNKFSGTRGRGRGRGIQFGRVGQGNWREVKMDSKLSSDSSSPVVFSEKTKKKLPLIIYDPKEIKDWREARKRNFPTTTNIEKKLAKSENEAELRRQQMKEILAKQEELGFEAAEVPTHYLNGSNKTRYDSNKNTQNSNRFNNKRGRFGSRGRGRNSNNNNNNYGNAPRNSNSYNNRRDFESKSEEPSLLKKLLSAEIKADKQRILHALKFMVLNEFFEGFLGGNKELEFPEIRINGEEKIEENLEDLEELLSDELLEHESENEKVEKSEEGEITD